MTIHHVRSGEGEPLVLLHGIGASTRVWEPVIPLLAVDHEVIALDMPGFGASPPLNSNRPASPANLASAIGQLLDQLGLDRAHLAGNSLGGWVAFELARADRARSVTAISPAGLWRKTLGPAPPTRQIARRLRPLVMAAMRLRGPRHRALSTNVARPELVPADAGRGIIADWIDAPGYDAANREMRANRLEQPGEIEVPVTIAWGDQDRLVGMPKEERCPPGAELVVLEGLGHVPMWDDPARVAGVIRATTARG